MKQKTVFYLLRYLAGIPMFALAASVTFHFGSPYGTVLFVLLAVLEIVVCYAESRRLLDLRILLSASWLLGISLATLGLSELQSRWGLRMWLLMGTFYFGVLVGYDLIQLIDAKRNQTSGIPTREVTIPDDATENLYARRILQCIYIISAAGLSAFLLESVKFRFVYPIFSELSHAYTEFHISGVHYFVVSLMFVHSLTVVYLFTKHKRRISVTVSLLVLNLLCFMVPILMLSKLNLLISLALPFLTFIFLQKRVNKWVLFSGAIVGLFGISTLFMYIITMRNYPEGYLAGIFRFRNQNTPIELQYVYMYIVNNFENQNLFVENVQRYSMGVRQLFPVFALTGTKFLPAVKNLMGVEQYLTVNELTTVGIVYDAYGDFGLLGAGVFSVLVGMLDSWASCNLVKRKNLFGVLLYGQLVIYMSLAFFATWFSNPTTWFWFAITFMIGLWCTKKKSRFRFSLREMTGDHSCYRI